MNDALTIASSYSGKSKKKHYDAKPYVMNSVRPILHIGEYSLVALQYQRIRYIGLRVSADTDRHTSHSHIKLPLHRLATRHVNETQVFFS